MITAAQIRAARALVAMDQRALADLAGLSLPTIQRMEASEGVVRGTVDSLMKLMGALESAGIEFLAEDAVSAGGGRGVRLKQAAIARNGVVGLNRKRRDTGSAGPKVVR
jgi:transcriptional regulator with XRE-family HTH domain